MFIIPESGFAIRGEANTFTALNTFSSGMVVGGGMSVAGGLTVTSGGASVSGGLSVIGTATATAFSGDGLLLTNLNANNLANGIVPLARLSGITTSQLSASAGIVSTQLSATGVSAGTYASATITVDAEGRVTAASAGGGGAGTGVTGTANVIDSPANTVGFVPDNPNDMYRITYATSLRNIDAGNDLLVDATGGAGNIKMYLNYSTRGFGGTVNGHTDNAFAINAFDGGFGVARLVGTVAPMVYLATGNTAFSDPSPTEGGMLVLKSFSPKTNVFQFWTCTSPDTVGGGDVVRGRLDSAGNLTVSGNGAIGGTLNVTGSITAGTKDFCIPHPLPALASKDLLHTSVESPRANLVYRGRATLAGGSATVNLDAAGGMTDGTLALLADMAGADVFVQNATSFARLMGAVSGNALTITCESPTSDVVSWLVVAERFASTMPGVLVDADGHKVVEVDRV